MPARKSLPCPPDVQEYVLEVSRRLQGLGCIAAFTTGSLALGALEPGVSDIDLIAVFPNQQRIPPLFKWTESLFDQSLPCPARGLELLIYREATVKELPIPLPYALAMDAGSVFPEKANYGGSYNAAILDIALCRQSGHSLFGLTPGEMIGKPHHDRIGHEVRREMRWSIRNAYRDNHDPIGAYSVLTCIRGAFFFATGKLESKRCAALWLQSERRSEFGLLALEARQTGHPLPTSVLAECRKMAKTQ